MHPHNNKELRAALTSTVSDHIAVTVQHPFEVVCNETNNPPHLINVGGLRLDVFISESLTNVKTRPVTIEQNFMDHPDYATRRLKLIASFGHRFVALIEAWATGNTSF